jgi:DNA-binding response OmpR family regulator
MPTALIVEDEPEANKLLAMLVQLHGYQTRSAFLGNEAVKEAHDHLPDAVLLDLMLPDVDGYQVCRTLKSSAATQMISVVVVTARLAAQNRMECFAAGADDFIPKPFMPQQIFAALDRARAARQQSDSAVTSGSASLDSRECAETMRLLARLRNRLSDRYGPGEALAVATAIKQIWLSVDRPAENDKPEFLTYALDRDRLSLTIAPGHKIAPLLAVGESPLSRAVAEARFERGDPAGDAGEVCLVKRFD